MDFLRTLPKDAGPMEVLRTAVSLLSIYDPDAKISRPTKPTSARASDLTSQIAMIVAVFDRIRKGQGHRRGRHESLCHAANFLWMLNGEKPSAHGHQSALDVALILHADHELNASTFAARVIAATLSDMHSAITGAIGALKGPLHGGANEAVMQLLYAVDASGEDPVEHVRRHARRASRRSAASVTASTHTEDPRATHLRQHVPRPRRSRRQPQVVRDVQKAIETLRQRSEKKLNANVDFYSASTYTTLGIDIDLFTPIFALSRIAGWCRPRPRATRRQPPHPPPRRLHRPPLPRPLHPPVRTLGTISSGGP